MSGFKLSRTACEGSDARIGHLELEGRNPIDTPHYVAISSRGTVPHITPDLMVSETSIAGIYAGLEDYVEQLPKSIPAASIPCKPGQSPLRRFVCLRKDALLVLGPRRIPPLSPSTPNTYTSIAINTSTGFRQLDVSDYIQSAEKLQPDVVIGPIDYELGDGRPKPGLRRQDKMGERTLEWTRGMIKARESQDQASKGLLFAPMLPIESGVQQSYLDYIEEKGVGSIDGLALYDVDSVANIPSPLQNLPRMAFSDIKSPQEILHAIDLGLDILTLPFISKVTDSGTAFTFEFPAPTNPDKQPLGLDMWSKSLAIDMRPLKEDCTCYACRRHHRAYLRHLLDAKEMLAWALLQIHNHHQIDLFFSGIRKSIVDGTFSQDLKTFNRAYEDEFPVGSGAGPRVRGYQIRIATAGPPKANLPARRKLEKADLEAIEVARALKAKAKLDDEAQKVGEAVEAGLFAPDMYGGDMEGKGFGNRQ